MPAGVIPASRLVPMVLAGLLALGGTVRVATAYVPDAVEAESDEASVDALRERVTALELRGRRLSSASSRLQSTLVRLARERDEAERRIRRLAAEIRQLEGEAAVLAG